MGDFNEQVKCFIHEGIRRGLIAVEGDSLIFLKKAQEIESSGLIKFAFQRHNSLESFSRSMNNYSFSKTKSIDDFITFTLREKTERGLLYHVRCKRLKRRKKLGNNDSEEQNQVKALRQQVNDLSRENKVLREDITYLLGEDERLRQDINYLLEENRILSQQLNASVQAAKDSLDPVVPNFFRVFPCNAPGLESQNIITAGHSELSIEQRSRQDLPASSSSAFKRSRDKNDKEKVYAGSRLVEVVPLRRPARPTLRQISDSSSSSFERPRKENHKEKIDNFNDESQSIGSESNKVVLRRSTRLAERKKRLRQASASSASSIFKRPRNENKKEKADDFNNESQLTDPELKEVALVDSGQFRQLFSTASGSSSLFDQKKSKREANHECRDLGL